MLKGQLNSRLNSLDLSGNVIVVLKGIPLELVDPQAAENMDYEKIVENKLGYFFAINQSGRKYLTYEEFLLLNEYITTQYKTIYIVNNNLYMNQYPVKLYCSESVVDGLLTHYYEADGEEKDDKDLGDISEFVQLFVGLKKAEQTIVGVYCDDNIMINEKVEFINLFAENNTELQKVAQADEFIDLIDEIDYVNLIFKISEFTSIKIRNTNYVGDLYSLNNHLRMLAAYYAQQIDIYILQPPKVVKSFEHREEYTGILKKYWGHDSFRELSVYDMAELDDGKKEVVSVSQESIISDLVQQVEKCVEGRVDFRDLFVTAPTGAGKSVMFQVPAIYLAEKHDLLTIVISPLIGLMNDQVKNLELNNYQAAKTINSDISPIIKQDITEKVADGTYNILYISPETLLSRSDVEQLIGNRTIGMIVIDEAHIVTTWGKQFRPDYWYLGDHIRKLRKKQLDTKGHSFVIATFTATAIYKGIEDMYTETINSLHMLNPITYLGYVKRNDINIVLRKKKKVGGIRSEYELDKFEWVKSLVKRSMIMGKKVLIYFPTVALIQRCYEFLQSERKAGTVTYYYGTLSKEMKAEGYEKFLHGDKMVMLATKAFGMGIDINDIAIVAHFAPTGNVCDYVQEIGRAARREDIIGEACYEYTPGDFKHINRLHGLSMIHKYQLIEVIRKITELYQNSLKRGGRKDFTRKRNAMLLDAENFAYIFSSRMGDEDSNINKVKTALLTIQKDFESKLGFSPINVRPIPLFAMGFFVISEVIQNKLKRKYHDCIKEIEPVRHICSVNLDKIWQRDYRSISFPQFKYMVYCKDQELEFCRKYEMTAALCVNIEYANEYNSVFERIWDTFRGIVNQRIVSGKHTAIEEIIDELTNTCGISKYKARTICEVVIASMDAYRHRFSKSASPIVNEKTTNDGQVKYVFNTAVNTYFSWVERIYRGIIKETVDGELYLINDIGSRIKEFSVVLGILEAMDVLSFKMVGGANSQLYIYINQIRSLRNILNSPGLYENRLLDMVAERHLISVKMLTYIYESDFTSEQIWDLLEDYFLGIIPDPVKRECSKKNIKIEF